MKKLIYNNILILIYIYIHETLGNGMGFIRFRSSHYVSLQPEVEPSLLANAV
jgi:hypothetical protein